jgi:CheY-like chemotaxis protein
MNPTKRVLIIEDDTFLGDVLEHKLKTDGFDVKLCRDGAEGLKALREIVPDLVLLDIILPSMNGYEILEAKQMDTRIDKVPVIVVSNSGQPVEISRALALGVKDYLVKAQLDPDEVVTKVKRFFAHETEVVERRLKGKVILWVEDDKFLRDLLSAKLGREGCISLYAENGERALNILQTEHPDVLLLDLILPGMSGFDVLKNIKAKDELKDIPVIVLSNSAQQVDIDTTKALGAARHLIKAQHDPEDIMNEISEVIGA